MDAGSLLDRVERLLSVTGLKAHEFLKHSGLPQSSYYRIKKTGEVTPKMKQRFIDAIEAFPFYEMECEMHGQGGDRPNEPDMVNSPPHYQREGLECIDAMVHAFGEDAVRTYARLCAFKYQWRADMKGKKDEDLKKAVWYLRWATGEDPRNNG